MLATILDDQIVLIGAIVSGLVTIIGAVFAGIAMLHAGAASKQVKPATEPIRNGDLPTLSQRLVGLEAKVDEQASNFAAHKGFEEPLLKDIAKKLGLSNREADGTGGGGE